MGLKIISILLVLLLISSFAVSLPTRLVTSDEYQMLKSGEIKNIDVANSTMKSYIADKIDSLSDSSFFIENGKISDSLLFTSVEKSNNTILFNRVISINRFWIAQASIIIKNLKTENDAFKYCLQNNTTFSTYRQCVAQELS